MEFDSTLGYPGEGWSSKHRNLRLATWNTRSLTFERFKYCEQMGYDVIALTELWRKQSKFQKSDKSFITSKPIILTTGPNKGKMRFPEDRAAGVGILLSKTAQQKVKAFGSQGERVCWVRMSGPVCNLFIIAVYLPHRARTMPSQDDTLQDLRQVLAKVPAGDCICLMGDFNEQLEGNVPSRTGKWTAGEKSANANKIMDLMRMHSLSAMNTMFRPPKGASSNTFLQTKQKSSNASAANDYGELVGAEVRASYQGIWVQGRVAATYTQNGKQKWLIRYTDGYVQRVDRTRLKRLLVVKETIKVGRQLDYVLVSTRWKSSVTSCRPKWGPAMHRDLHGHKNDHALVECVWRWRMRCGA